MNVLEAKFDRRAKVYRDIAGNFSFFGGGGTKVASRDQVKMKSRCLSKSIYIKDFDFSQ